MGKFDPKFDKGIFFGYSTSFNVYRVYNSRDNLGKFDPKSNNGVFIGYLTTSKILGHIEDRVKTRSTFKDQAQMTLLSEFEPKNVEEALLDDKWILAMQKELDQFQKNDV
ncbi:hypothetical protein CR513_09011, partial [Mucuna pruriens]